MEKSTNDDSTNQDIPVNKYHIMKLLSHKFTNSKQRQIEEVLLKVLKDDSSFLQNPPILSLDTLTKKMVDFLHLEEVGCKNWQSVLLSLASDQVGAVQMNNKGIIEIVVPPFVGNIARVRAFYHII